ncbi:DMT family transporter [Indiicoccus explosivorum]|uniref:DMT family transporter n=1 Tax=Indiicoccus explosivorum TaxID=1917864 RepID=UPI000B44589E|nr:multidrug efflux SMR transporter [Indiicoccus explosivorum]
MAWVYLLLAGVTEIVWAIGLKEADGFTDPAASAVTILFITISFFLFARAIRHFPIGTAYAVFTGIGAAGTAVAGIVLFGEEAGPAKVGFFILLVVGIIGLKLSEDPPDEEGDEELWRG